MPRNDAIEGVLDGRPVTVQFFLNPLKLLDHCRKHVLIDPVPALALGDSDQIQDFRDRLRADSRTPKGCLSDKYNDVCRKCPRAEHCMNDLAPLFNSYWTFVNSQLTKQGPPERTTQHGYEKKTRGVPFACSEGLFAAMYPGSKNAPNSRSPYNLATAYCPEPQLPARMGLALQFFQAGLAPQAILTELILEDRYLAALDKLRTCALDTVRPGALGEG